MTDEQPRTEAGRLFHDELHAPEGAYEQATRSPNPYTVVERLDRPGNRANLDKPHNNPDRRAASPPVAQIIKTINTKLTHYNLNDNPNYIRVPTERVRAFRIVAHPHYGVIQDGKFYNLMEWNRLERQRAANRKYMQRIRASHASKTRATSND